MTRNTKVVLMAVGAVFVLMVVITVVLIAISPLFNLANVVSGGH